MEAQFYSLHGKDSGGLSPKESSSTRQTLEQLQNHDENERLPMCDFVFGNDQFAPILGYGDLIQGNVMIKRVYYVEGLNHNLFSVGQFCDADLEVAFRKSTCFVRDLQENDLLTGSRGSDLYNKISSRNNIINSNLFHGLKASPTQAWQEDRFAQQGLEFSLSVLYLKNITTPTQDGQAEQTTNDQALNASFKKRNLSILFVHAHGSIVEQRTFKEAMADSDGSEAMQNELFISCR
ncbi:hypothetical protein Tco_0978990 [Tanacetum coccineum]|uniref:Integrase, catalytic region, zinc finger, CCHC-type, peptidase aspartic, catalytic n=1 Tax=Tanacetum coccineum TaxID=301880 RepID=A0ABQ5EQ56_9ASTR